MYQKQRMAVFYLYKISPRGRYCQQRGYVPVVTALIRTVILYLILIVGLRLTGKRQIGELEPIELVLTMLLSDLASVPMQNFGIPLLNGLVPIVTLLSLSMLLSWCSLHSVRFRSLVCGEPAVIIRDGKLEQAAMRRNRLTLDELLEALRAQGVTSLGDVKYAILETSGQLSVLLRTDCQPATPSQLGLYCRRSSSTTAACCAGTSSACALMTRGSKSSCAAAGHTRLRTCSCSPWTSAGASSACEKRR